MIGTLITIAIVFLGVGAAVLGNWHKFVDFVMDVFRAAVNVISKSLAGVKCFVKKVWGSIQEIVKSYNYDRERDRWTVTTETYEVPPDKVEEEIPDDIRAAVNYNSREHDVTEQVELKLKECA